MRSTIPQRPVALCRSGLLFVLALGWASRSSAQSLAWAGKIAGVIDDGCNELVIAPNGDVLVTGYFTGAVDLDPGNGTNMQVAEGGSDAFVQRLTSNGDLIWVQRIGGVDYDYGTSIAVDGQGNVYVTGAFEGTIDLDPGPGTQQHTSLGNWDVFILKLSAQGDLVWAGQVGGVDFDESSAISVSPSGEVFVSGYFSQGMDVDPGLTDDLRPAIGGQDMFLLKLDPSGGLAWAHVLGGPGTDLGLSSTTDALGACYVTGSFEETVDFDPGTGVATLTSAGAWDIFVLKLDAQGTYEWAKRMGGAENFDTGYDITVDDQGNVITVGSFFGSGDFDPGPGVLTLTTASLGSDDVFVQKLDPNGDLLWAERIGGESADLGYSVALEPDGGLILSGYFQATVDMDPDPIDEFELTTSELDSVFFDVFYCRLDPDGGFRSAGQFGGANSISTQSVACDAVGNIYFAGQFEEHPDFDPGPNVVELSTEGFRGGYVMRLGPVDVGLGPEEAVVSWLLAPNPATDHLVARVPEDWVGARYRIIDALGRTVADGSMRTTAEEVPLNGLQQGMYSFSVLVGRAMRTQRFQVMDHAGR